MSICTRSAAALRRFCRSEAGVISTELLLVLPLLIWVFLAMFVYWEAYRAQNTAVKATAALADMISRESAPIDSGYITGMSAIYRYATAAREESWLRVTLVQYREQTSSYERIWSRSTNTARAPAHTNATIASELRPRLPLIADADTLIVVESWQRFTPAFRVGLERRTFYELSFEKMRSQALLPIS